MDLSNLPPEWLAALNSVVPGLFQMSGGGGRSSQTAGGASGGQAPAGGGGQAQQVAAAMAQAAMDGGGWHPTGGECRWLSGHHQSPGSAGG